MKYEKAINMAITAVMCDVTYNWKQYELDKNRAFAKGKKYYDKWLEVFSEQVEENGTIAERPTVTWHPARQAAVSLQPLVFRTHQRVLGASHQLSPW